MGSLAPVDWDEEAASGTVDRGILLCYDQSEILSPSGGSPRAFHTTTPPVYHAVGVQIAPADCGNRFPLHSPHIAPLVAGTVHFALRIALLVRTAHLVMHTGRPGARIARLDPLCPSDSSLLRYHSFPFAGTLCVHSYQTSLPQRRAFETLSQSHVLGVHQMRFLYWDGTSCCQICQTFPQLEVQVGGYPSGVGHPSLLHHSYEASFRPSPTGGEKGPFLGG